MTAPSLSIIVPTIGRPTLKRTLESIAAQELLPGDEVLVVQDGPADPAVREPIEAAGWPWRYLATGSRANDFGATPRNLGMKHARADFLAWIDDDDPYRPGAFAAIRRAIKRHPGRPLMFRMERPGWNTTVWRMMAVRYGNVSTQMFVAPNQPDRLGTWGSYRASDLAFICSTLEKWPPGSLVWEPFVVATVAQEGSRTLAARPLIKNLLFHVYPHAGNEEWRMNVERLARSWHLFTGRRIIGIATGPETVDVEVVKQAFPADTAIEWLVQPNDPKRGESVTFLAGTRLLRNWSGNEVTCYCHAKGTSRRHHEGGPDVIGRIRRWRDFMYKHTLEVEPAKIDRALRRHACAGSLKIYAPYRQEPGRPPCLWHFSGTFFWVHHAKFFALPGALDLGPTRWAVERHLGEIIPEHEAYCFAADHMEKKTTWAYNFSPADWDRLEDEAAKDARQ